MPQLRILVVDDHRVVCEALALLIDRQAKMRIVGSASTADEAEAAAVRLAPDVVVMDLMLPGADGFEATRRILHQRPQSRIIALSACHEVEQVHRALHAGVCGYVLKSAAGEELLSAIMAVTRGEQYFSPAIAGLLAQDGPGAASRPSPIESLSTRERAVLRGIVGGSTSAEIAHALSLSRKTVETYRSRIMVKMGVPNRSALIRAARKFELPVI